MQDLMIEMSKTRKELNECLIFYKNNGRKLAEAEMKYRVALRKEILKLKIDGADEGGGSVAWTVCNDLSRGQDDVAKLRFERDIRKSDYDVCYERILFLKVELRILENEIAAERHGM